MSDTHRRSSRRPDRKGSSGSPSKSSSFAIPSNSRSASFISQGNVEEVPDLLADLLRDTKLNDRSSQDTMPTSGVFVEFFGTQGVRITPIGPQGTDTPQRARPRPSRQSSEAESASASRSSTRKSSKADATTENGRRHRPSTPKQSHRSERHSPPTSEGASGRRSSRDQGRHTPYIERPPRTPPPQGTKPSSAKRSSPDTPPRRHPRSDFPSAARRGSAASPSPSPSQHGGDYFNYAPPPAPAPPVARRHGGYSRRGSAAGIPIPQGATYMGGATMGDAGGYMPPGTTMGGGYYSTSPEEHHWGSSAGYGQPDMSFTNPFAQRQNPNRGFEYQRAHSPSPYATPMAETSFGSHGSGFHMPNRTYTASPGFHPFNPNSSGGHAPRSTQSQSVNVEALETIVKELHEIERDARSDDIRDRERAIHGLTALGQTYADYAQFAKHMTKLATLADGVKNETTGAGGDTWMSIGGQVMALRQYAGGMVGASERESDDGY